MILFIQLYCIKKVLLYRSQNTNFPEFLHHLDSNISLSIIEYVLSAKEDGLIFIKEFFQCNTISEYLSMTCEDLLPNCIIQKNTELIKNIDSKLCDKTNIFLFIKDNLHYIIYQVFIGPTEINESLKYILSICPQFQTIQNIIDSTNKIKLIKLLVWDLGKEELISDIFTILDVVSDMFYDNHMVKKSKYRPSVIMLKENFLFLLYNINNDLLHAPMIYTKIYSLNVLNQLIIHMKNEIKAFIPNIISTLISIRNNESLIYQICTIYNSVLINFDDETLVDYIDIFFIVLTDYYMKFGISNDKHNKLCILLNNTFNNILKDKKDLVNPLFEKYYFLFNSLSKDNIFKKYIKDNNHTFDEKIIKLNEILNHDHNIILDAGLKELYEVLKNNKKELILKLTSDQYINNNIEILLQRLFDIISYNAKSDSPLLLLTSKILGEIGAIDPSKLSVLPHIESTFNEELDKVELAIALISKYFIF